MPENRTLALNTKDHNITTGYSLTSNILFFAFNPITQIRHDQM